MDIIKFGELIIEARILENTSEDKSPALTKRGLDFGFLGSTKVAGKTAQVIVGISKEFPNNRPTFFLANINEFDKLPHIEDDGFICYTHDDTIVLDIDNPSGILRDCFDLAMVTLEDGILKKNELDFYNEYEAYWRQLKDIGLVYANIMISDEVALLKIAKVKSKEYLFVASDEEARINSYQKMFDAKENPPQFFNGVYIPLKPDSKIMIPDNEMVLNLSHVKEIIFKHITPENEKKLAKLLTKTKLEDLIVIGLPQPNGYWSLFAVQFKNINHSVHPLVSANPKATIVPHSVTRLDPEYILTRGGTGQTFSSKKVLVIGGGSVGSAVCEELVKAAILNIDIVDKEKLEPENCYRHNCGFRYAGVKKAIAIRDKLHLYYPHSNITPISTSIEEAIEKKKISFNDYDAIVVSTGNATVNQFLMRLFKEQIPGKPVLFSWLDPFGIGGHCLISNISDKGCYKCLYSNDELHNIASFASANQPKSFAKNISGCGSVYVPYGSLDANQTAILTVRKILSFFLGKEKANAIYSWKGDSDLFLREGHNASPRYSQTAEELEESKSQFYQSNCKLCGEK